MEDGEPVEMNETQFISYSRKHGNQWWNCLFEPHTPTEEEIIDELEFIHGSLFQKIEMESHPENKT